MSRESLQRAGLDEPRRPPVLPFAALTLITWWALSHGRFAELAAFQRDNTPSALAGLAARITMLPALAMSMAAWGLAYVLACHVPRKGMLRALTEDVSAPPPASCRLDRAWLVSSLIFVVACLAFLEAVDPCYFTKDDNFTQFLPNYLVGASAWLRGIIPTYNPYQFMGSPTFAVGQYLLSYPPLLVAHGIARFVLGNVNLTHEVHVWLHLLAAHVITYKLTRWMGLRPGLAACASICFVLSGMTLITGRSWAGFITATVWIPLIAASVTRLARGPVGWQWVLLSALAVGGYFHAGNAQMWLYAVFLSGLAVAIFWSCGVIPFRRALACVPMMLLAAAVAAPLLVPQMALLRQLHRISAGGGGGIGKGLLAMLLPHPWAAAAHPNEWGNVHVPLMTQYYYSGTIFILAGLAACVLVVVAACASWRRARQILGANAWLIVALVAFLLALGPAGGLWTLQAKLPIVSKFKGPAKLLHFVNFFSILAGGIFLERLLRSLRATLRAEIVFAGIACCLMAYHVSFARAGWGWVPETPYPQLPPAVARLAEPGPNQGRVLVVEAGAWPPSTARGLGESHASVYRIPAFWGYSPDDYESTVDETRAAEAWMNLAPVEAARAFGIRWLIVSDLPRRPASNEDLKWAGYVPRFGHAFEQLAPMATTRLANSSLWLLELPHWDRLVFAEGHPEEGAAVELRADGVSATFPQPVAGRVVFNFLWRPELVASADGRKTSVTPDTWGRAVIQCAGPATRVDLRYEPPFARAALVAVLFFAAACGFLCDLREDLSRAS